MSTEFCRRGKGDHIVRTIIFDLSEVLISGLVGIERVLSRELAWPEDEILRCFVGGWLEELLVGDISEETYLARIVAREKWPIDVARLKAVIRANFHHQVEGTIDLLRDLVGRHCLALLSDNAREWVSYIRSVHPFLEVFQRTFFSYDLKGLKKDPATFFAVLDAMSTSPGECLFIDDNPLNVSAAQSARIPSIHFLSAEQLAAELDGKLFSS